MAPPVEQELFIEYPIPLLVATSQYQLSLKVFVWPPSTSPRAWATASLTDLRYKDQLWMEMLTLNFPSNLVSFRSRKDQRKLFFRNKFFILPTFLPQRSRLSSVTFLPILETGKRSGAHLRDRDTERERERERKRVGERGKCEVEGERKCVCEEK